MTLARLLERLDARSAHTIPTDLGPLKTLPQRGPHLAAAAVGFDEEEPETLGWIRSFLPGDVFYDVGAATGLFSMYAALKTGIEVYAFEPKGTSFGVLIEHLALNDLGAKVFPLCIALSDVTGATRLTLSALAAGSGGNSLGGAPDQFGLTGSVFEQGALAYRLDDLIATFRLPPPTHLKIDVDGLEGLILKGAPLALGVAKSVMIEVEGENARLADERIIPLLTAAGLKEDPEVRDRVETGSFAGLRLLSYRSACSTSAARAALEAGSNAPAAARAALTAPAAPR
jgi:FkbM family methyltransferase